MRHSTWLLVLIPALARGQAAEATATLASPDRRLAIAFRTVSGSEPAPAGGQLVYTVSFGGKPLITPSALRLELQGQRPLGADVRIVNATISEADRTGRRWTAARGSPGPGGRVRGPAPARSPSRSAA